MDKPLHVQVAEALGCKPMYGVVGWECTCKRTEPFAEWPHGEKSCGPDGQEDSPYIREYDTDWNATGPLIERFGIRLSPPECHCDSNAIHSEWLAEVIDQDAEATGPTALGSICLLILALHAAGKLKAA